MVAYLFMCAQRNGSQGQVVLLDTFLVREICNYVGESVNIDPVEEMS